MKNWTLIQGIWMRPTPNVKPAARESRLQHDEAAN